MASQLIIGGGWLPTPIDESSTAFQSTLHRLNAENELSAFICRAPKAGNVVGFEVLVAAVANPLNNGLRFSFQGLSASSPALNDGVIAQSVTTAGGTPSAAGWLNPGDFDAVRAVARGDILVMVVDNPSWTAGDDIQLANATMSSSAGFPYAITALTTVQTNAFPIFALRYQDGTYGYLHPELWGGSAIGLVSFDTLDTPDEYGTTFTPPWPCTLEAVTFQGRQTSGGGNTYTIVVYDSDGTSVLHTQDHDWDVVSLPNTAAHQHKHTLSASVPFAAGGTYRVVIKAVSATVPIDMYYHAFPSLAHMDMVEGGSLMVATGRADAGGWVDYDNVTDGYRKAHMFLFVNGWTD